MALCGIFDRPRFAHCTWFHIRTYTDPLHTEVNDFSQPSLKQINWNLCTLIWNYINGVANPKNIFVGDQLKKKNKIIQLNFSQGTREVASSTRADGHILYGCYHFVS